MKILGRVWMYIFFAIALGISAFSLLNIFEARTNLLWKLSILVQECGHWIILPCLALAVYAFYKGSLSEKLWISSGLLAVIAAILLSSVVVRALVKSSFLAKKFDLEFSSKNYFSRLQPIKWQDLFRGISYSTPALENKTRTLMYSHIDSLDLKLDFYPTAKVNAPCVIVIHGGGWNSGDRTEMKDLNYFLVERGYAVASIDYRLAPKFQYSLQLEDVQTAIKYLQSNHAELGIDGQKLILLGRSAGGQLALQAAYLAKPYSGIKGVIAFYAPADMVFGYHNPCRPLVLNSSKLMEDYLGGSDSVVHQKYLDASPLESVHTNSPPTLLLHGKADVLVSFQHTVHLEAKLKKLGVRYFTVDLPWATHGFDYFFSGPDSQISLYFIERFLDQLI